MKFFSTRNPSQKVEFNDAVLMGIAPDGGLFVPENFPKVNLESLKDLSYKELAFEILSIYLTDVPDEKLKEIIDKAYTNNFPKNPAPLTKAREDFYLELYHGNTHAFKDFALSILPLFMENAIESKNIKDKILILTATSGDTGSAALYGFRDLENIDIAVLFPENGVSKIQRLQMTTVNSPNTLVMGIDGNFDDAQGSVKKIFTDEDVKKSLKKENYILSSANSINIGRLLPQIVYYFHAYNELVKNNEINLGDEVSFVVPTGNFGDILAGFYAKEMGLPVKKLVIASNENNVLTEFFNTGIYDANRSLKVTNSPSMDIIISSNLERLLYHETKDSELVKKLQDDLSKNKIYNLKHKFSDFYAGNCDEEDTLKEIKKVYDEDKYLIDPHTAVAKKVSDDYKKETDAKEKIVILSTASPFKFADTILNEFHEVNRTGDVFSDLKSFEDYSKIKVPSDILNLKDKEVFHKKSIEVEKILENIMEFVSDRNEN
ncbi:threonine synthase [Peptoniphilus sp.]|jgi:threonine synthase|uniref:threonine synthase n=1 Tax=Peptoniphilus sp. TaxID=1971214 RepID=UPI003D8AAE85